LHFLKRINHGGSAYTLRGSGVTSGWQIASSGRNYSRKEAQKDAKNRKGETEKLNV